MKIGVVGDIHYSQYSSIIRGRGNKYSKRIEACINSINWVEELFESQGVSTEIFLGDFFDTDTLDSETITSLNDIKWNNIFKYLIVGNHEMGINTLEFSSSHVLNLLPKFKVVDKPCIVGINDFCEIAFLPYTLESNRKPLEEYFGQPFLNRKRIICSHNDISGIQMGKFMSNTGFSIEEIQKNCNLFLNGHLHNGGKVADRIFNVGILCGQNFSEDAIDYDHCVFIVDTDTLKIDCYENPYSFNFYKLDYVDNPRIELNELKNNAIISMKINQSSYELWKKCVDENPNIIESRIIIVPDSKSEVNVEESIEHLSVDHLEKFNDFIIEKLGTSDVVKEELIDVCK